MIIRRFPKVFAYTLVFTCAAVVHSTAHAQAAPLAENATVTGELEKLGAFSRTVHERQCSNSRCESAGTWRFQASFPGRVSGRITFKKARFPRTIERMAHGAFQSDLDTRPVLLRGKAFLRHGGSSRRTLVRIGGTVFRDQAEYVLQFTLPSARANGSYPSRPVVFRTVLRQADARLNARAQHVSSVAYPDLMCGDERLSLSTGPGAASPSFAPPTSAATFQVIFVATDFDSQYQSKVSCTTTGCKNRIISIVDQSAVYFENQFGFTLEVARQYGPTSLGTSTNSSTALDVFRNLNNSNRDTVPVDLFQLYTGRTMQNNIIGLAYLGVVCQFKDFSAMLVQHVSDIVNPVTAAHEMAHTLNGRHTTSGIMASSLSFPLPSSFDSESVSQISPYFADAYPGCIGGTSGQEPTPTPTRTPTATPTTPGSGGGGGGGGGGGSNPTPTPTPQSGSGGGGGDGGDSTPVTLALSAKSSASGTVRISTTVTQIVAGCSIELRAGTSVSGAYSGTVVALFEPAGRTTVLTADIPFKVRVGKRGGPTILFGARYVCPGNTEVEVSLIKRLNPNRVKNSRGTLSKTQWIRRLNAAI